jgi:hypothetical protein
VDDGAAIIVDLLDLVLVLGSVDRRKEFPFLSFKGPREFLNHEYCNEGPRLMIWSKDFAVDCCLNHH